MSVLRKYSQRNNNVTQLTPVRYEQDLSSGPIQNSAVYILNISRAQFVGGIYCVDLNGVDSLGNSLVYDGSFGTFINTVSFVVNIDVPASGYPGLEIPIFFKNFPSLSSSPPLLTIGILSSSALTEESPPLPYIMSPPVPVLIGGGSVASSITFKSDGTQFNVASSGPAGWLGIAALLAIESYYAP